MAITLKVPATKFDHTIGSLDSSVIMVEYGDFQCPNTARAQTVTDRLIAEFRNDLCFVFRHFPRPEDHPNAVMASLAAEAAGVQGMFWKMCRHLLEHQDEFSVQEIIMTAKSMGLDTGQFIQDLESEELLLKIQNDIRSGEESGVEENTPSFFLNGILMENPTNYNLLRDEIQSLLEESSEFREFL